MAPGVFFILLFRQFIFLGAKKGKGFGKDKGKRERG